MPVDASAAALAIFAVLALALLSTAVGYLIYFRVLSRAGATNALLVTFLIPVSAILLGILLLWAVFGRLDIVAVAEGKLVPQSYVKIVQPSEAGEFAHVGPHMG